MIRKTRILWAGGVAASVAIALVAVPALLQGDDSRSAPPANKLVVHEWGTFTSFAGTNGVNLEFRPLVANDLPPFVKTPYPKISFLKQEIVSLQRMETPVTYFYTDVPRVVNVRVDFPQGMLTEWYPTVKQFQSGNKTAERAMGGAYLDWDAVRLTPQKQFAAVRLRDPSGKVMPAALPEVAADNHYVQARETDSAIVETVDPSQGSLFEKFLFYRGLGNFELPIKLTALGHDRFEVANSAADVSGVMLLVRIESDHVRFTRIDPVKPRAAKEINLPKAMSTVDQLAEATVRELTAAGLYEKEALAMVNTWRSSWFGENGTRLLYLVPGKLTDELLPLTIDPAPDKRVRVLVGRLETLTPEDCRQLTQSLVGNGPGEKPTAEAVKAELATLGRFAEPAVQFVISQTTDPSARDSLEAILADIRAGK